MADNIDDPQSNVSGWYEVPEWEQKWTLSDPVRYPPDITAEDWPVFKQSPWLMIRPFERAQDRLERGVMEVRPQPGRSMSCRQWSLRKERLLACAAVRTVWHLLPGDRGLLFRHVVTTAELHADELATAAELLNDYLPVLDLAEWIEDERDGGDAQAYVYEGQKAALAIRPDPPMQLDYAVMCAMTAAANTAFRVTPSCGRFFNARSVLCEVLLAASAETAANDPKENNFLKNRGTISKSEELCHLVREIIGNPFRPVRFNPRWRTDRVLSLARLMYDGREFNRMRALADALQSSGCDNEAMLHHCHRHSPHVRGCWVVDLVLGKS